MAICPECADGKHAKCIGENGCDCYPCRRNEYLNSLSDYEDMMRGDGQEDFDE